MSYQVIIPCAGTGSRLGNNTKFINKALIEINNKPVISHMLEKFSKDSEFIIPLGYKGKDLKDYLEIAHSDLNIITETIEPFEGDGSGLGTTLMQIFKYLDSEFIFSSCDTLVKQKIPNPNENWIGYSFVEDASDYRTISLEDKNAIKLNEKNITKNKSAYIGLSGIKDYENFKNIAINNSEEFQKIGESFSIREMIESFKPVEFTWYDTGNLSNLKETRKSLYKDNNFNILEKESEKIWFVNNKVIKFSADTDFINNRCKRAKKLERFVPQIICQKDNFYSYAFQNGEVLSNKVDDKIFYKLLKTLENLWELKSLDNKLEKDFQNNCYEFYKDKTYERYDLFLSQYPDGDKEVIINNNKKIDPYDLLKKIDWNKLSQGLPSNIHGDLHFENILLNEDKFTLLDWRQSFNNLIDYGDIYYDFGKLLHGIVISHSQVLKGNYKISESENKINVEIEINSNYSNLVNVFTKWLKDNNYDVDKVNIMCSLILINIAPLHHHPYSRFLFYFGLLNLDKILSGQDPDWV